MRQRASAGLHASPVAALVVAGALALAGCGGGESSTTVGGPTIVGVQIKDGKPVGGIQRATVNKGEVVALVVRSDVADEVHVHGYDLHKDVKPGRTVRIQFKADIVGVFEAELESRKLQIVELTVK